MVNYKKIKEYIVWNNCNNSCSFCFLKTKLQSSYEQKFESLKLCKEDLMNTFNSHLLIMGGEIFVETDTKTQDGLRELFILAANKMEKGDIERLYINTNILYKLDFLESILDIFEERNLTNRINFTTSYDVNGRFKSKAVEDLFKKNIKILHSKYPNLMIIANTILTNTFCNMVLNGEYNIENFEKEFGVTVNPIPYIHVCDDGLVPTRKQVIETLFALDRQQSNFLKIYCDKMKFDQPRHLLQFNVDNNGKGFLEDVTAENNTCGHCINFTKCFSDSKDCFVCLIKEISKIVDYT